MKLSASWKAVQLTCGFVGISKKKILLNLEMVYKDTARNKHIFFLHH